MSAVPVARHLTFARFVERACDHAWAAHGWTKTEVAEHAGIGRTTLYAWLKGDLKRDPLPAQVVAFCDALDIPTVTAFSILWPGKGARPAPPAPLPLDPDFEVLLRRLEDPAVPDAEKYHIRETVRALAMRAIARRQQGTHGVG